MLQIFFHSRVVTCPTLCGSIIYDGDDQFFIFSKLEEFPFDNIEHDDEGVNKKEYVIQGIKDSRIPGIEG